MEMKKSISEIVYESGGSFKEAESHFFQLDKSGPRYQVVFNKSYFSPIEAFNNNDYGIKQVLDGKLIENEIARNNLATRLFTYTKK